MELKQCIMETGNEYLLYTPEHYDENTLILNFTHGGPASINNFNADTKAIKKYLEENYPDCFVVMPMPNENIPRRFDEYGQWDVSSSQNYAEISNQIVDEVANNYGLNKQDVVQVGFSWGGIGSVRATVDNLKNNPNLPPQTIVMNDPATYKQLTDEEIQLLKDNKTLIFYYDKVGDGSLEYNVKQYAKEGIPVIYGVEATTSHPEANKMVFEQGIIGYVSGNGPLSEEGCDYQYYDLEENKWKKLPPELLNNIDDLYNFLEIEKQTSNKKYSFNITPEYKVNSNFEDLNNSKDSLKNSITPITSDLDYVASNINNIRADIKSSNILNSQTNPSIESTIHVPAQAIDILYQYSSSVITLMDKLVKETASIANIGIAIDNQDKELETETEEIIDTHPTEEVSPNKEPTPTPSPIIPQVKDTQPNKKDNISEDKKAEGNISKNETQNNKPVSNNASQNSSQTTSQNHQYKSSSSNQNNTSNNQPPVQNDNSKIEETTSNIDFPKYEEIYSNDNQIVYNYNDECKLIVHHEGNQITGIEYYYDLGSKENAFNMFDEINNKYSSIEGFQEVIQNDRYVKVVLSNDYANKFNINDIKNKFSNLQEIIK